MKSFEEVKAIVVALSDEVLTEVIRLDYNRAIDSWLYEDDEEQPYEVALENLLANYELTLEEWYEYGGIYEKEEL